MYEFTTILGECCKDHILMQLKQFTVRNTSELLTTTNELYKSLRPSMILKTEKMTERIVKVLKDEYVNPFGEELDKHVLYNLSSGVPLPDNISENILAIQDTGRSAFTAFVKERLVKKSVPQPDYKKQSSSI